LDAGVIGTSLVVAWQYVAAFLLGLVALLLILIAILIFINRTDSKGVTLVRRWLIHLLGGNLYDNTYDELSGEKNDVEPIIHHSVQIKQEANKLGQITPPISFLTDTSIDHYYDNKSQAQKVQQTISKFIKKLGIDSAYQNTVIMPQYAEISFDVPSQKDIDEILKSQAELLNLLKVDRFNISFKGNLVKFEIPNKLISKISIRQILNSIQNFHPHEAIAGLTYDNTPLVVNVDKHPNIIIIGRRGSGAAMLLTVLLITLAYANKPSELEYVLISPLGDKSLKYLDNLPQMQSFITDQVDECIMKLHQMLAIIEDRENKFKEIGAKTLAEHNNYQSNAAAKLKMIVLTISTFDYLLKNSLQNVEILQTILKRGPSVGVKTILLAINVNNESIEPKIYDQTSARFILRLESEHESLKIFDSYRGIQLNGNGDGYYFDEVDNKKIRFQSCYLNVNELAETVKVIKTFYETKEQLNH
jgi:S-DNA-T family DNA segregation ATPase FtsK/SpoIIIE